MSRLEKQMLAVWRGDSVFELTSGSGHTTFTDGDARQAMSPMELLLGALVGCAAADVASILEKKRQAVTGMEVKIHGMRCEEHPRVYTDIEVKFIVTGRQVDPVAVRRALELTESKYCSVSAMLAKRAQLVFDFEIREAEPAASAAG